MTNMVVMTVLISPLLFTYHSGMSHVKNLSNTCQLWLYLLKTAETDGSNLYSVLMCHRLSFKKLHMFWEW